MDQELREALAGISGQMAAVRQDTSTAAARATEASISSGKTEAKMAIVARDVDGLKRSFDGLKQDVVALQTHVFGPSGPPPTATAPVLARVSENELEQDALMARVILIEAGMAEQTKMLQTIHDSVVGVVKHPMVQKAAKLALLALIGWLTFKQPQIAAMLPEVLK
jgi:hypothetical protein